MKRSTMATIGGTAAGAAGGALASVLAMRGLRQHVPGELIHRAPEAMTFEPLVPGASRAVLWGDPDRGAYAAYVRFAPGAQHPMHTHPHDIALVVLSGAYIYTTPEKQIRVTPGSYLFIPGGTPHISGADPVEGLLMYTEGPGRFGLDVIS